MMGVFRAFNFYAGQRRHKGRKANDWFIQLVELEPLAELRLSGPVLLWRMLD